jgi:hypothetical protein
MTVVVKGAADVAVVSVDDCDVPALTKYRVSSLVCVHMYCMVLTTS